MPSSGSVESFHTIATVVPLAQPPSPNARITLTPDATNEVGQPHTFIATVEQDDGLAAGAVGGDAYDGFGPAVGANVAINLANANGAVAAPSTPLTGTTNASGQFLVTFASPFAGQVIGNATATLVVGSQTLTRDTDPATANIGAGPGGSGPAVKTFVDAKVIITPDATNEVGQPHTFTVTVLQDDGLSAAQGGDGVTGFALAVGADVTVALAGLNGASPVPGSDLTGITDSNGQFQVTFNSATAGQVVGNATATVVVGGLTLVRDTDPATANIGAGPGGSGPATKTYVDAKVTITPNATNEVGQPHSFTVTVLENAGNGAGFVPAAGETVTVTLTSINGAAAVPSTLLTGTTDANGQFVVTFNSAFAGQVIGNATASIVVGGLTLTRDTDPATASIGAGPGGSGPAVKTYVDAKITIAPNATNQVGDPHTFTVTVLEDAGNGAGFVPAAGESVTVTLLNTNGATSPTTSFTGTTNASGQFLVTFTSPTAGQVIGNATATIGVGGLNLMRDTDPATANIGAGPGGSGPATKTYVDASVSIAPTGTNEVGQPHTFTVTVLENAGTGAGFVAAAGETVTVTLVNTNGATTPTTSFTGTTNASGQFLVTFNSATAGQVIGNATATVVVGGLTLTRDTDPATASIGAGPGGSGSAIKTYVDASISITPTGTNEVGQPHTFVVSVLENAGNGAGFVAAAGESVTVTLVNANGATTPTTSFTGTTNASGQFQITFNSSTAGQVIGNASATISVGGLTLTRDTNPATANIGAGPGGSGPAIKTYVDANITIGPSGTNVVGDPHTFTVTVMENAGNGAGFVPAAGESVTVVLTNQAGATVSPTTYTGTTNASGQFLVTFNSATAGQVLGNGTATIIVGGLTLTRDTNPATTTIGAGPGGSGPATKVYIAPGIDLEKTTNGPTNSNPTVPDYDNEDAGNGPGVPVLTPGSTVTWTYKVTNTGSVPFAFNEVVVVDDNGTPSNTADDLSTTNGQITFQSVQAGDADNILEPGEVWLYKASGIVQTLAGSGSGTPITFDFSGSETALDGPDGNIRTFTVGGVSVNASAFSRNKTSGAWSTAYLGRYGGGLGVTDAADGTGSNNAHTVDNIGSDNYVLLEFSQNVIVDAAFLGYVVGDSDLQVWIGTVPNAFTSHQTLSDLLLGGFISEVNATTLTTTRTANFNAGNLAGNIVIIAADPGDTTPDDQFKIDTLTVTPSNSGIYENKATVTVPGATDSDLSHYKTNPGTPGIDLEKTTNGPTNSNPTAPDYDNEDSANGAGVPLLTPGSTVTWTYKVTNTGSVPFAFNEVVVVDDNGTPSNTADDMSTANGQITFQSVQTGDADNILEPGEVWLYKASGIVQTLTGSSGSSISFDFSGSETVLDGPDGNIRTFTVGGVSVNASAFSRNKTSGAWSTAYLGRYGGGLGVTDAADGTGSNNAHTVDNIGSDNYVLLEFSQNVIVDAAFLGYVVGDSDLQVWIGTVPNAFTSHQTLSDLLLGGFISEMNATTLTTTRTANFNAGNLAGNILIIAADPGDTTPDDQFKIDTLTVTPSNSGIYENKATVTVPGATDSDLSHYKNSVPGVIDITKYVKPTTTSSSGGQGLTPGFWKQTQHFQFWTGYTQSQSYNTVFGVNDPGSPTLLGALQRGGGGYKALGRHAVAALLNASNPNVSYAYTVDQVITLVQNAFATGDYEPAKNLLAVENEKEGVDLNNPNPTPPSTPTAGYGFDANTAPGLVVAVGTQVTFTYVVTNPGQVPLTNVVVTDDNETTSLSDDFNPTPVLEPNTSFNAGDDNANGLLDPGELWVYTWTKTVTSGQHTNIGKAVGTPSDALGNPIGSSVSDTDAANWFGGQTTGSGSISGTKYKDETGNGLTVDDTPLAGVTIYLDANNNSQFDSGEVFTVTGANGTYTFLGLQPGTYKVREVVPAGYIRTNPTKDDYYAVSISSGTAATGKDFANFYKDDCACSLSNISYTIKRGSSTFTVTNLRDNTNEGDIVTANFTVAAGSGPVQLSLVSYTAPDPYFDANRASLQKVYELATGFFLPGTHSLTVRNPNSYFQIDFVCGAAIDKLGPAGSNIFYTPQDRLISADNDGLTTPTSADTFIGATLVAGGSSGNDSILFKKAADPTKIAVLFNGQEAGQVYSSTTSIPITRLAGYGYGGNDAIEVSTSLALATAPSNSPYFHASLLKGGSGNDTLKGGNYNDILQGESGDDCLIGNAGRDFMIGGTGRDVINGNADEDILIAGTTQHEASLAALDAIMKEWTRTDASYSTRVSNLKNGTGLNGSICLTDVTVDDDGAVDTLTGSTGSDWFFYNKDGDGITSYKDVITDLASGEVSTDIDL